MGGSQQPAALSWDKKKGKRKTIWGDENKKIREGAGQRPKAAGKEVRNGGKVGRNSEGRRRRRRVGGIKRD